MFVYINEFIYIMYMSLQKTNVNPLTNSLGTNNKFITNSNSNKNQLDKFIGRS